MAASISRDKPVAARRNRMNFREHAVSYSYTSRRDHVGLLMTLGCRNEEGEETAQECIRRYRVKTMAGARHKCMIVCGDQYAIFDPEELMMQLGQPVRCPMRTDEEQFRKLHGL